MDENGSDDERNENVELRPTVEAKKPKIDDNDSASSSKSENAMDSSSITETEPKRSDSSPKSTVCEEEPSVEVKPENVDSGIAGESSENASFEDQNPEQLPLPQNLVTSLGLSAGDISLLRNFMRSRLAGRNYRRRSQLEDSDSSSPDSDDASPQPAPSTLPELIGSPDTERTESDDHNFNDFDPMEADDNSASNTVSEDESPYDVESMSEGDPWTDPETSHNDTEEDDKTPAVLLKPPPKHNWFLIRELINRESNLLTRPGRVTKSDVLFEQRYYGSLHAVQRLELMSKLNKHKGCVNSINFHPEGHLLASGSDDLNVVVWDWAINKAVQVIRTGHKSNVFQSKFLHLNAWSQLNIVTCARDGQVRLLQCPASGGTSSVRRRLHSHKRSAHKLHTSHHIPHQVYSAGEDAEVIMSDVRAQKPSHIFKVEEKGVPVPLYSIHGNPLDPHEMVVAGRDSTIRVFDTRRTGSEPKTMYCPNFATTADASSGERRRRRYTSLYVTCAVYNHDGTEILASYNDDDIYLFDTKADVYDKDSIKSKYGFSHRYSGHRNSDTFKGVAFFGPKSEFVISGSDCSHIYIWEKQTESIVQWMLGDEGGVVNCLESHPRCPVLATSGLDKDIKIWVPSNESLPKMDGLKDRVKANHRAQLYNPLFEDFLPRMYTLRRRAAGNGESDTDAGVEIEGNVCSIA